MLGCWPPFRPGGIIDALRRVIRQPEVASEDILITGPPDFLTGCTVTGDLAALAAGRPVALRLQARLSVGDDHRSIVVENLPPNANRDEVVLGVAQRAEQRDWAAGFAVYLRGPGTVVRCPACDSLLMVFVQVRGLTCVDLQGVAALD